MLAISSDWFRSILWGVGPLSSSLGARNGTSSLLEHGPLAE